MAGGDILRVSKFRANLWISYFFDDITTFLGFKNLSFVGDHRFSGVRKILDMLDIFNFVCADLSQIHSRCYL